MDIPVELVPLACIRCGTFVPAQADEVAWVCAQCGQGLALDEDRGLISLDVHHSDSIPANSKGKPFWVAEGRLALQRETYGSFGARSAEAQKFWGQPRSFFVPAYSCPLETRLQMGIKYLADPPSLSLGPPTPFEPVTLASRDVKSLAEFVIMAVEAGRKDNLKEVHLTLELSDPVLWILP